MKQQDLTKPPPIWLVPRAIKTQATPELVTAWFAMENRYCLHKLRWSALVAGLALWFCIYLDVTYTPPADLAYSLIGRGALGAIGLLIFAWFSFAQEDGRPQFIRFKGVFALYILLIVAYQFQYSLDYANRARYLPPAILVLGLYALRVGPSFSGMTSLLYTLVMGAFAARAPQNLREDGNLLVLVYVAAFLFQSRIQYEARAFVSEWREKQRLETSERDAKLSASNAYRELVKLVYPHVVDLVQSGQSIETTMPVGHAKAAILCFDIADSSSIQHERFDEAIEMFQARLYDLMCGNYDGKRLVANGYRIKDVGDGVFYSVGFPFQVPDGCTASDQALLLAIRGIAIFHEEMDKLNYPIHITVGVGIAHGHVEGFFPRAGQKQYDLRGRGIVLATRYQELRKAIKAQHRATGVAADTQLSRQSLIVVNEPIYNNLSPQWRSRLAVLDLRSLGLSVRNDPNAALAYWIGIGGEEQNAKVLPDAA